MDYTLGTTSKEVYASTLLIPLVPHPNHPIESFKLNDEALSIRVPSDHFNHLNISIGSDQNQHRFVLQLPVKLAAEQLKIKIFDVDQNGLKDIIVTADFLDAAFVIYTKTESSLAEVATRIPLAITHYGQAQLYFAAPEEI